MVKLNKNGAVSYKIVENASYNDYFEEYDGWSCNECGEIIPPDERELSRHLYNEHQIEVIKW